MPVKKIEAEKYFKCDLCLILIPRWFVPKKRNGLFSARWLSQYRRWRGGEAGSSPSDREAAEILLLPGWNQFKLSLSYLTFIDRALLSISHSYVDPIEASLSQWWPVVRYFQSQSKFFLKVSRGARLIGTSWVSDGSSEQLFQVKLNCLKFIKSNQFQRFKFFPGAKGFDNK